MKQQKLGKKIIFFVGLFLVLVAFIFVFDFFPVFIFLVI